MSVSIYNKSMAMEPAYHESRLVENIVKGFRFSLLASTRFILTKCMRKGNAIDTKEATL